jgi:hypothetical protein
MKEETTDNDDFALFSWCAILFAEYFPFDEQTCVMKFGEWCARVTCVV